MSKVNEINNTSRLHINVIGGGVYLKNKPQNITITWEIKDDSGNRVVPDMLFVNNIKQDPTLTSKTFNRVFSDVDFTVRAVKGDIVAIGTTTARFVGPTQTVENSLDSYSHSTALSANQGRILDNKIENATNRFKGLFLSVEDLSKKFKNGVDGDWAIVGESIPAPIFIWNKNQWEASGGNYDGETVDLTAYSKKQQIAEYTDDYNVSKNHQHSIKVYDDINWSTIKYDKHAPVFRLGDSYDSGEIVNMVNDEAFSYKALNSTNTAPYLTQKMNSFTLEEAISFLPEDLRVSGQKISFYSSEKEAWMTYVFTGGDYTNPTYWEIFTNNIDPDTDKHVAELYDITDELDQHLSAVEDNLNSHITESNNKFDEIDQTLEDHSDRMDDIEDEILMSSVEAACSPKDVEILADRAYKDHTGKIIADEYVTRNNLTNEIINITNQQVTDLKPGSVDPEDLSEATKQLLGNKNITNLPDEEDITVDENNLLKFKDKEYSPKDYSGMGRKVLRKHYVNGVNTLTQHMINKPNTIYIIQYDYCLADQTIEIPENCVLQFEGGSFKNGTVNINNRVYFSGNPKADVIFKGESNQKVDLSWFITDSEITNDISYKINNLTNVFKHFTIKENTYNIKNPIVITSIEFAEIYGTFIYGGYETNISVITFSKCIDSIINFHATLQPELGIDNTIINKLEDNTNIVGITIENSQNCTINIGRIEYFNEGLRIAGVGAGCCNNTFRIEAIFSCNRGLRIYQTNVNDNIGWSNENYFFGGHIGVYSGWKNRGYKQTAIHIEGSNREIPNSDSYNKVNALLFYGFNCEGHGGMNGYTIYANNVRNSSFNNIRNEAGDYFIKFLGDCLKCEGSTTFGSSDIDITECYRYPYTTKTISDRLFNLLIIDLFDAIDDNLITNNYLYSYNSINNLFTDSARFTINNDGFYFNNPIGCIVDNIQENDLFLISSDKTTRFVVVYIEDTDGNSVIDNMSNLDLPKIGNIAQSFYYRVNEKFYSTSSNAENVIFTIAPNIKKAFIGVINNCNSISIKSTNRNLIYDIKSNVYKFNYASAVGECKVGSVSVNTKHYFHKGTSGSGENSQILPFSTNRKYSQLFSIYPNQKYTIVKSNENVRLSILEVDNITLDNVDIDTNSIIYDENAAYIAAGTDGKKFIRAKTDILNVLHIKNISNKVKYIAIPLEDDFIIRSNLKIVVLDIDSEIKLIGTNSEKPHIEEYTVNPKQFAKGFRYYDTDNNEYIEWDGKEWINSKGFNINYKESGTYLEKPYKPDVGFAYFCTDKQTSEGSTNGIMIYHKGDNVWVDALGRIVK